MFLARAIGWILRLLSLSWRVSREGLEEAIQPPGPVVYAFLHGSLVCLAPTHRTRAVVALISQSGDGDFATGALQSLGMDAIRGSTTKGGAVAFRTAVRRLASGTSVALAVDGPRGPAGKASPGAVELSKSAQVPLVWVRAECDAALRLKSWDAQAIPLPFSRVRLFYGVVDALDPKALSQLEESLLSDSCCSRGLFKRALSTGASSLPLPSREYGVGASSGAACEYSPEN